MIQRASRFVELIARFELATSSLPIKMEAGKPDFKGFRRLSSRNQERRLAPGINGRRSWLRCEHRLGTDAAFIVTKSGKIHNRTRMKNMVVNEKTYGSSTERKDDVEAK